MLEKFNPMINLNFRFDDFLWNNKSELSSTLSIFSDDFKKIEFQESVCRFTDNENNNKLFLRKKSISFSLELTSEKNLDFCINTLTKLEKLFKLNNKDAKHEISTYIKKEAPAVIDKKMLNLVNIPSFFRDTGYDITPELLGFDMNGEKNYKVLIGAIKSEVIYQIVFLKEDKFEHFKSHLDNVLKEIEAKLLPAFLNWLKEGE